MHQIVGWLTDLEALGETAFTNLKEGDGFWIDNDIPLYRWNYVTKEKEKACGHQPSPLSAI